MVDNVEVIPVRLYSCLQYLFVFQCWKQEFEVARERPGIHQCQKFVEDAVVSGHCVLAFVLGKAKRMG